MTSTASTDWPRAFLFQIYDAAITNGLIIIEPISEEDARSLAGRLYRIRRRSDKALAQFILPEYHLVTVGEWRPGPEGTGQLPIIYSRLPDGKPLPLIRPALPEEMTDTLDFESANSAARSAPSSDDIIHSITSADLELKPDEVNSFVDDLMSSALRKAHKMEEPEQ